MAEDSNNEGSTVQRNDADEQQMSTPSEFNVRSILVLTACSLSTFCSVGFLNSFGTFQAYYTIHYLPGLSDFQISWIGSFGIFMLFGCGPLAGYLGDVFGPKLPIGIAVVCQLVAIFMISLCREYYQFFLAQGVLLGFAMSLISIPTASIPPLYFQRNRGLAQGVSVAGSSLGGVIWPITFIQLSTSDTLSFGWTMRIIGFIQLPLLAIVLLGVRRPAVIKPAKHAGFETSTEIGTGPQSEKKEQLMDQKKQKEWWRLRHPSFYLLCAGLAIFYFGFFAPIYFVTTYGISLGTSESFATYLIAILNAASLFGRIVPGYVADRVGHFNTIVAAMLGSGIVCFCWTAVTTTAGLVVWSLAYGFISGAVLSLQFACTSLVASKEIMGVAMGIMMASIALTGLFGSPIAGELVKQGYLALSAFAGATMLAGAVLVFGARLARNRKLLAKA